MCNLVPIVQFTKPELKWSNAPCSLMHAQFPTKLTLITSQFLEVHHFQANLVRLVICLPFLFVETCPYTTSCAFYKHFTNLESAKTQTGDKFLHLIMMMMTTTTKTIIHLKETIKNRERDCPKAWHLVVHSSFFFVTTIRASELFPTFC